MSFTLSNIEKSKESSFKTFEALEAGEYDAVLSAIVGLETQMNTFDPDNPKAEPQMRLIFELPSEIRTTQDGAELTAMLSLDVKISAHKKSKFTKVVSALMKTSVTEDEVLDILKIDGAINELLGKACTIRINKYKTRHNTEGNSIKDVMKLDPRLPQPEPVREPFVFSVAKPDLEIFKEKLTKFTRDKIMNAVNRDEFPKELQKAYKEIQEQEASRNA